jgi:dephospho-CoA kinase
MKKRKSPAPLVIGLTGTAGSGKDTVASYIKHHYQAEEFRFSYLLVKALEIFGIEISRGNLAWLTNILKRKYGQNVLTRAMKKTIDELSQAKVVVISGLRLPPDYHFLREFKRNRLVFIDAPAQIRWKRVRVRGEKTDDRASFKDFLKLTSGENERHIVSLGKKADFVIMNDGNIKKLHRQIDQLMKKIL